MNKIDGNILQGYQQANRFCDWGNSLYSNNLYFEPLCKNIEFFSLIEKKRLNTSDNRRKEKSDDDKKMGITLIISNKKSGRFIFVEPRINTPSKNHFKSTYVKGTSDFPTYDSDFIFLKHTGILTLNKVIPRYYYLFQYGQVPEECIKRGSKGRGNARRHDIRLNLTPIPIQGRIGLFPELDIETAIIKLINKIGKTK